MSKLSIDRLQLQIIIDNDQARNELRKLEKSMNDLQKQIRKTPEGSEEWKKLTTELKNNKAAHDKIIETLGVEKLTVKELSQRQKELNAILRQIEPGTEQHKKLSEQLRVLNSRQRELTISTAATKSTFQKLADGANHLQGLFFMVTAAIYGTFQAISSFVQGASKISDALSDIRKTTNLTQVEVEELSASFRGINTRSSRAELLELARIAGKLGVEGKENIFGFVRAADQINVALTKDLGGNTEEAIRQIGKLVQVFKVTDQFDLESSLLKVGSAINALGASSTASEQYMVEFAKRVAGVSVQSSITIQDVFGLGAALDNLGQTAEVSSTALSGVWVNMFKEPGLYAEIAGKKVNDFVKLLNKDANEAFLQFLSGLNGNNSGLTQMAQKLDGLGLDGKRTISVLASLSQNVDLVRKQQKLSNEEFFKGTDLTREFNIKNENLAATLAKIGKALHSMFMSPVLINGLNAISRGLLSVLTKTEELSVQTDKQRLSVFALAAELTNSNIQEERKKVVWEQLNRIAPEVLTNIQSEFISTQQLTENLKKYNEEMIRKIALQEAEVPLKDKQKIHSEALSKRMQLEITANQQMADIYNEVAKRDQNAAERIQHIMNSDLDVIEKFDKVFIAATTGLGDISGLILNKYVNVVYRITEARQNELLAQNQVNEALDVYTQKYNLLMQITSKQPLGPSEPDWSLFSQPDGPPEPPDQDDQKMKSQVKVFKVLTEEEQKALEKSIEEKKKAVEKYYDLLHKLRDENTKNNLSAIEKELFDVDQKYKAAYEIAAEAGKSLRSLEKEHVKARADVFEKYSNKAADDALKAADKFFQELEIARDKFLSDEENAALNSAIEALNKQFDSFNKAMLFNEPEDDPFLKQIYERQLALDQAFPLALRSQADYVNASKKLAKDKADYELKIEKEKTIRNFELIADTFARTASLFEEHTVAFKLLASAQAVINTWLAATAILAEEAKFGPIAQAIAVAATITTGLASVAKINAVQFVDGKYDVIGASDGKTYQAGYVPSAKSGLYTEPTLIGGLGLVAEKAPELVFDGLRTRAIINTPGLVEALMTMRAPQFASGNYPSGQSTPVIVNQQAAADFSIMQILLKEISEKLDKPTRAAIVYSDLDNAINEVETIKKSVSK